MRIFKIYGMFPDFRATRFAWFLSTIKPSLEETILDIGGYPPTWTTHPPCAKRIDCLNIREFTYDPKEHPEHHVHPVVGDGCALDYPDSAYDTVYSNSVIEHLSTWENQVLFAKEARRVGRKVWIQTPAYEFFMEPHYITPFIHWLPKRVRLKMLRYFTVWGHVSKPTDQQIRDIVDEIRLLSYREMKLLFPDCEIIRERFLGVFTKSYVAVRE